jgi:hypothetical protein
MAINLANTLPVSVVGVVSGTVAAGTPTEIFSLASIQDVTIVNESPISVNLVEGAVIASGVDGIMYFYDSTRGKNLSVARSTLQYGRDTSSRTTPIILNVAGGVIDVSSVTSNPLPRDATITAVTVQSSVVAVAPVMVTVRRIEDGGAVTDLMDIELRVGTVVSTVSGSEDIDVDVGNGISCVTKHVGGAEVSDPVCNVELAWRND